MTAVHRVSLSSPTPGILLTEQLPIGIQSAMCKEKNQVASKLGAKVILQGVLGRPINEDELGPDVDQPPLTVTVVPASTVHAMDDTVVEPDPII